MLRMKRARPGIGRRSDRRKARSSTRLIRLDSAGNAGADGGQWADRADTTDGASTAMNATCTKREGRHRKRAKPIVLLFILLLSLPLAGAFDPQKTDGGDSKSCDEPAANMPTNKEEWPELAGKTGEEAKAAILKDDSKLQVDVLPEGSMVTMDYRLDRVRIFVDEAGKVARAPRKG